VEECARGRVCVHAQRFERVHFLRTHARAKYHTATQYEAQRNGNRLRQNDILTETLKRGG
jgi:hypothetical protein